MTEDEVISVAGEPAAMIEESNDSFNDLGDSSKILVFPLSKHEQLLVHLGEEGTVTRTVIRFNEH
jgi:hypothetical protein